MAWRSSRRCHNGEHLAFNTTISLTADTVWQSYAGEARMSNGSQMLAPTIGDYPGLARETDMGNDITTALRPTLGSTILFAILLGIVYPLAMTGLGQALFTIRRTAACCATRA